MSTTVGIRWFHLSVFLIISDLPPRKVVFQNTSQLLTVREVLSNLYMLYSQFDNGQISLDIQ